MSDSDPQEGRRARLPKLSSPEGRELLVKLTQAEQQREQTEDADTVKVLKQKLFPTSEKIRKILFRRIGETRQRLLSHHGHWAEKKLREGLEALVNAASAACVDLHRHDAALAAYANQPRDFTDHVAHTIENPAQKDVMAFCAAATAIVDTTRRIRSARPDLDTPIGNLITSHFDNDLTIFIKDLRNNLAHGSVAIPSWVVRSDASGITGAMAFNVEALLSFGDWSKRARQYAVNHEQNGQIRIITPIGEYFRIVSQFHSEVLDLFARHITDAERDYFEIEDEHSRWAKQQFAKILVTQIGKGRNPYDYLHRFFTASETRQIRRFPNHSKKQVDYIIALRLAETACDDDLRNALYAFFGATNSPESEESV